MKCRAILLVGATVIVALAAAPGALAAATTASSVRVQGATSPALPRTVVHESNAGGTIVDTDGTSFATTNATALGATAAALHEGNVSWDMSVGSFGPFINSIAGLSSNTVDFSNWWELVVNGYSAPVGAGNLQTVAEDRYLWFQNPDATFSKGALLLVDKVKGGTSKFGFTTGQTVTVTTVGDDLAKVDSQADATRFSTTDVQTPEQFPAVIGATLHVGSRVYTGAASSVAISDLAPGTYAVWSEKAMDATTVYATSDTTLINVGVKPSIGTPTARRKDSRTVTVSVNLSGRSSVAIVVTKASKTLASFTRTLSAGAQKVTLRLSAAAPRQSTSLKVKITTRDNWGRRTVKSVSIPKGK